MPEENALKELQLPPLPASVEAVLQQLYKHKPMTGKELREATGLPRRTIYTALRRLREMGLLEEQASLRDTRQTYFWLHTPKEGEASPQGSA